MIFPSLDCEAFEVKGFVLVCVYVCVCAHVPYHPTKIALAIDLTHQ